MTKGYPVLHHGMFSHFPSTASKYYLCDIPQGTQAQQKTTVGNIYLLSTKLLIWCYYRHIDFKQHNKDIILISKIIL